MKHSYVMLYRLPRPENIVKIKVEGQEIPFYPLSDDIIGIVMSSEEEFPEGAMVVTKVPSLEFLWNIPTVVYEYEDYMKLMDDPTHVPKALMLYKEDASEDSSGST